MLHVRRLKIKWDVQLAKGLLLLFQILVAEFFESALSFEIFQEFVHLFLDLLLPFANSNRPPLLLKRFKNGSRGLLMLLPMFEHRHLIVDESLRFVLKD